MSEQGNELRWQMQSYGDYDGTTRVVFVKGTEVISLVEAEDYLIDLEARLAAETQRREEAERERDRDMVTVERLVNLIDGYGWLAEGRGPYAYDDGRYDDDVMHFVQSLLEAIPTGRWSNIQQLMSEYESAKTRASFVTAENTRLQAEVESLRAGLERIRKATTSGRYAVSRTAMYINDLARAALEAQDDALTQPGAQA